MQYHQAFFEVTQVAYSRPMTPSWNWQGGHSRGWNRPNNAPLHRGVRVSGPHKTHYRARGCGYGCDFGFLGPGRPSSQENARWKCGAENATVQRQYVTQHVRFQAIKLL